MRRPVFCSLKPKKAHLKKKFPKQVLPFRREEAHRASYVTSAPRRSTNAPTEVQMTLRKSSEVQHPALDDDDHVLNLDQVAAMAGISPATLKRRMADGTGPQVTKLSPRRIGVRKRHYRAWLDECAR
jgi:predicted DNA-binding transcriptional regulator AlpA